MGQKLLEHSMPAGTACSDAVIGMGSDESVLILIRHCREMKRQEARLRLITLFLLLSCTALFMFNICAGFRKHVDSGSSGQGIAAEPNPAYSKHDRGCSAGADDDQTEDQGLRLHFRSEPLKNATDKVHLNWMPELGPLKREVRSDIVIPKNGLYYIYMRFTLFCKDKNAAVKNFHVKLQNWSNGYGKPVNLTEVQDSVKCQGYRSVSMGQLFDLLKEDRVNVWMEQGYTLISKSSFGVFLL